ncbi:MAG TPA: hypothetical protein VFP79_11170 [Pseudolabrys sp.]|nr:hypothetical protein [Pseudolabrys sp.]
MTKYRAKYGKAPSYFSESNYTTAQLIDETIKKAGGKWPGADQFVKIMAGLKIDAVRGSYPLTICATQFRTKEMFAYAKPELWNTVIKPIKASVSF